MSQARQNGHADPEEMQEKQHKNRVNERGVEAAMARAEEIHNDLLDEITDSDLNPDSRQLLKNLISKDFIFANLTEAEVTEMKWNLQLLRRKFYDMHPSQKSVIEGATRAYVYDDAGNTLSSLTQQERIIIDQFFEGVYKRVTRARKMRQQEILKTQIQQSVTGDLDAQDDKGGIWGRMKS